MTILLGIGLLSTAVQAGEFGLVPEPADVAEQYRLHAAAKGLAGPATELVCEEWFDQTHTCLTIIGPSGWRYATKAALDRRKTTAAAARASAIASARDGLKGFQTKTVDGMTGQYWSRNENDGREASVLVAPVLLQELTRAKPVVAVPVQGAVIAWIPGNPQLDQILAVGVTQMNEPSAHPISTRIYRFEEGAWRVWGEAVKPVAP